MKVLIIRLVGLGDVASILLPAVKILHADIPQANIDVMTFGAGVELMTLAPEVNAILAVTQEQWPGDMHEATASFMSIANVVMQQKYDLVINLDTWFMPCFLAKVLKESGLNVQGNTINLSIDDLAQQVQSQELVQEYFQSPSLYLASSYPNMPDWTQPWWERHKDVPYPEFYLNHCCGFERAVDISIDIEADTAFKSGAGTKKIVALSLSGSKASKQYKAAEMLKIELERAGFFVWSQFDGSLPMQITLARLKVTDLLVTVATSTQWLAKLVGCPSLMIPGALPPSLLGAEITVDPVINCQYCYQNRCVENIDFACMDVAPKIILSKILGYFYPN